MENGEGGGQEERKQALEDDGGWGGAEKQNKTSLVNHTYSSLHIV